MAVTLSGPLKILLCLALRLLARSAAATVNVRSPIVSTIAVELDSIPVHITLRSNDRALDLAHAACARLEEMERRCTPQMTLRLEAELLKSREGFDQHNPGERALLEVKEAWKKLRSPGEEHEAWLLFTAVQAEFPGSTFLLRETAAAAAQRFLRMNLLGQNRDQNRSVVEHQTQTLEQWESCAALRFQRPQRPLHEEESELLAAGAPAAGMVPRGGMDNDRDYLESGFEAFMFAHRLRHDLEQIQMLQSRGLLDAHLAQQATDAYSRVLREAPPAHGHPAAASGMLHPSQEHWALLYPFFNRRLYVHPSPRVSGKAAMDDARMSLHYSGNPAGAQSAVGGTLEGGGVLVVDNVLSAAALQSLYEFATFSTIYYMNRGEYVGASMFDGFATPLLDQVANDLRAALPDLICDMPLGMVWAFKFDDEIQSGIMTHADNAAVNINLWVTPDEDNLDPGTGGLIIFDAARSPGMDFGDFNRGGPAMDEPLRATGFSNVTVPYRRNRAVLFDSARFHTSAPFKFRRGSYSSRRINITFLFGYKGQYCPRQSILPK